jgi:hypothetical protein
MRFIALACDEFQASSGECSGFIRDIAYRSGVAWPAITRADEQFRAPCRHILGLVFLVAKIPEVTDLKAN